MRVIAVGIALVLATSVGAEDDLAACKAGSLKDCTAPCDEGDDVACLFAGAILTEAGDPRGGATYLKKACDFGLLLGCTKLGVLHELGSGVARDVPRAIALYTEACEGGESGGCYNAARLHLNGAAGHEKDPAKALPYLEKACALRLGMGCYELGLFHYFGKGGTKDFARAMPAFDIACQEDHAESCLNLGGLHVNGQGTPRDLVRARVPLQRACQLGSSQACQVLQQIDGSD